MRGRGKRRTSMRRRPGRGGAFFERAAVSCVVAAALPAVLMLLDQRTAHAQCVDEELKQELVGGRHYRGVQDRLFTKAFRHELSAMGGVYAGDLYSSSWIAG